MKRSRRYQRPSSPEKESRKSETGRDIQARNDRWCFRWTEGAIRTTKATAIIAVIIGILILLICAGCATQPKEPVAMEEESLVRYAEGSVERSRGIIARTQKGNFVVTGGYMRWSEHLAIDLEAEKAKTEQERLKNLNAPK